MESLPVVVSDWLNQNTEALSALNCKYAVSVESCSHVAVALYPVALAPAVPSTSVGFVTSVEEIDIAFMHKFAVSVTLPEHEESPYV